MRVKNQAKNAQMNKFIFTFLFLTFNYAAFAADNERIKYYFETEFYNSYMENKCGLNIDGFVHKLSKSKVDISRVLLVHIDGSGDLSAYSARKSYDVPGKITWGSGFHYIMLLPPINDYDPSNHLDNSYQALLDYEVIDFDFMNEPTVVKFKTYLEKMYMHESIRNNPERIGKTFVLALIKFSIVDATKYITAMDPNNSAIDSRNLKQNAILANQIKFFEIYPRAR